MKTFEEFIAKGVVRKQTQSFIYSAFFMLHAMIVELSKGRQVTIPAKIRNELALKAGSKLEIVRRGNHIILQAAEDLDTFFQKARQVKPKRSLTAKQMDELNERLFR